MVKVLHISDTHSNRNLERALAWQKADILIHSGDGTNLGSVKEFEWLAQALRAFKGPVLYVPGNHDLGLDGRYPAYPGEEPYSRSDRAYGLMQMIEQLAPNVVIKERHCEVYTMAGLKIMSSPMVPTFGDWAFMNDGITWTRPDDVDLVVTHGPAYGIADQTDRGPKAGCPSLLEALKAMKPKAHLHGHIHEAAGVYSQTGHPWVTSNASNPGCKGELFHLLDIEPKGA